MTTASEGSTPPESGGQLHLARESRVERFLPYALILAVTSLCHGFLVTNDGPVWDGWYTLNWIQNEKWRVVDEFFSSVGIPLFGWLYRPFAAAPDIIGTFMWATLACFVANSVLTYHLALRLGRLTRGEALAITLLAGAMPLFTAAQEFIMFWFIATHTLFLAAALALVRAVEMRSWRHWFLRLLACGAFLVSFSNAALLVYYGGFYVLFFLYFKRLEGGLSMHTAAGYFLLRYPEFLALPPIAWIVRLTLTPQYGWYGDYNMPGANLHRVLPNLGSFFQNVIPYHLRHTTAWMLDHPVVLLGMVLGMVLWRWRAPKQWQAERGDLSNLHLFCFGGLLLFFAIFPYAAAGKPFSPTPVGDPSRYCLLAGLPMAVLLFAVLRAALFRRTQASRLLPPVVGCVVIVLACQIPPVYVAERVEWIFSRSVLHNAVKSDAVRESSVIVLQGLNLADHDVYGTYGFATASGELTRLVTGRAPANMQFFTPLELTRMLLSTTILPSEFRRINPAGQQTLLVAEWNRDGLGDWQLVSRYLALRYFGSQQDLENFLGGLCQLKTGMLKRAFPLLPSIRSPDAEKPSVGVPDGNFTNGVGMRMVRVPEGWWAGRFETTQAEYERLMGDNPSLFKDSFRPVECISWDQAMEFCTRLTDSERSAGRIPTGFAYRLPTVKEFDQMTADASLAEAVTSSAEIRWRTAPVGMFPSNRLGLHDVLGNVWEWCLDWSDDSRRLKVSKGASWVNQPWELAPYPGPREVLGPYELAAAERLHGPQRMDYPDQGFWDRGFRCVLAPPHPPL